MIDTTRLRSTVELLDLVREHEKNAGKPDSDYQAGKALRASPQRVSNWRNQVHTMDDDTGLLLADLVGLPRDYVMACLYFERAKSDATKAYWRDVGLRAANSAAVAAAVFLPAAWIIMQRAGQ